MDLHKCAHIYCKISSWVVEHADNIKFIELRVWVLHGYYFVIIMDHIKISLFLPVEVGP